MAPKLAFLFLTRGDVTQPELWNRYFEGGDPSQLSVYVHAKEPDEVRSKFLKGHCLEETIPTARGDVALVRATLLLLKAAMEDPANEYFVLVSETCIPIQTFEHSYRSITDSGKSWINYHMDTAPQTEIRFRRLKESDFLPRSQFFKHDQWLVLHRDAAEAVLKQDYTELFTNIFAADEHYFTSVLLKQGFPLEERVVQRPLTFVNWDDLESVYVLDIEPGKKFYKNVVTTFRPKTYSFLPPEDLEKARAMGSLFFRKVSASCDCSSVLNLGSGSK